MTVGPNLTPATSPHRPAVGRACRSAGAVGKDDTVERAPSLDVQPEPLDQLRRQRDLPGCVLVAAGSVPSSRERHLRRSNAGPVKSWHPEAERVPTPSAADRGRNTEGRSPPSAGDQPCQPTHTERHSGHRHSTWSRGFPSMSPRRNALRSTGCVRPVADLAQPSVEIAGRRTCSRRHQPVPRQTHHVNPSTVHHDTGIPCGRRSPLAEIRFYVDADLLALARALVASRYDVTFPGELRIVAANWRRIEQLVATDGPSAHIASMTRFRAIDLRDVH